MRALPSFPVLARAVGRRIMRALGRERDPFGDVPEGLSLSPSQRHFAAYKTAPLKLRYAGGGWPDAAEWQRSARETLAGLSGYERGAAPPVPHHEQSFALTGGLTRRRVYLAAGPGTDIPVHLIERPSGEAARPVMICLQGTNTGAHLSWGEVRFPDDADKRRRGYDIAVQAAERGYLAVALEQACFGERAERRIAPRSEQPCIDASLHALLLGRSLLGERCSDVSAAIDWIAADRARLRADPRRIHVMGHSSGGTTAMYAAALDPRIAAVLACGCVGFVRDTIGRRRDNSGQGTVPGLLKFMESADVVGLIAPRPFVTVAGDSDHIWPAAGAASVVAEARAIYTALGAADLIDCVTEPGGHSFRPEPSWRAFEAALERQRQATAR